MNPWTSKKLSILFFQKPSKTDNVPLSVTKFKYYKHKMKQEESLKSLEILLDENLM